MARHKENVQVKPRVGRFLTDYEQEAWDNYEATIDKISAELKINLRGYDRPSIHEHFPEINEAFENVRAMHTFYELTNLHDDTDN